MKKKLTIGHVDQILAKIADGKTQARMSEIRRIRKTLASLMINDPRILILVLKSGMVE